MRGLRPTALASGVVLCLLMCAASRVQAQSRVRSDVDTTLVTVGDRISLTVWVDHPAGATVTWPDSIDVAPFEVLGAQALPTETEGDQARSGAVIALAAFELGELEIPSFDISVTDADGGVEVLTTDRFGIEVVSVGADESGDIREIRGPFAIALSAVRVGAFALVLLALIALLYVLFRRLRRSTVSDPTSSPPAPARPAHEIALEAFAKLESSPMLERGQVKEYHIEASDILRRYVEARFGVTALEMTTWEIIAGLERAGADQEFIDGLRGFLDQCDLVKFAKVRPGADESCGALEAGRALVEESIPSVEPEAPEMQVSA